MGFPIKKHVTYFNRDLNNYQYGPSPSGLDLLSGAIDSTQQPRSVELASKKRSPVIDSSSTVSAEDSSISDNADHSVASSGPSPPITVFSSQRPLNSNPASSLRKRARAFPEILVEILSNPDYAPIVSWLPHGKSFAIHDPTKFGTQILPKYFRKVIFRSFVRKLNRWGFRSVKRSVSGFDATFEHKLFVRDRPELADKMYCKSNPSSKAPTAAAPKAAAAKVAVADAPAAAFKATSFRANVSNAASDATIMNASHANASPSTLLDAPTIFQDKSPANFAATSVSQLRNELLLQEMQRLSPSFCDSSAQVVPRAAPLTNNYGSLGGDALAARKEEITRQLKNDLILREMQYRRRQHAMMELIHRTPLRNSDIVSQYYTAERLRRVIMQQQGREEYRQTGLQSNL